MKRQELNCCLLSEGRWEFLTLIVLSNMLMWTVLSGLQGWGTGNICLPMTQWLGDLPRHAHTCRHWLAFREGWLTGYGLMTITFKACLVTASSCYRMFLAPPAELSCPSLLGRDTGEFFSDIVHVSFLLFVFPFGPKSQFSPSNRKIYPNNLGHSNSIVRVCSCWNQKLQPSYPH